MSGRSSSRSNRGCIASSTFVRQSTISAKVGRDSIPRENAGSDARLPPDFARRIEQDCAADMALYETALGLCA